MPQGDWGPGTTLNPITVNITVDENLVVDHVGIGYYLMTPSGALHEGAFTWHSPKGDYAHGPGDRIGSLQRVLDALLQAAASYEGVALGTGGAPTRNGRPHGATPK